MERISQRYNYGESPSSSPVPGSASPSPSTISFPPWASMLVNVIWGSKYEIRPVVAFDFCCKDSATAPARCRQLETSPMHGEVFLHHRSLEMLRYRPVCAQRCLNL
jgi:hypothetical protein